jgi:hypothetical protein
MKLSPLAVLSLTFAMLPVCGWAAGCQVKSPSHAVALVELYTSEGCSSCPPADQWLSTLGPAAGARAKNADAGFDYAVPLSLHVNYWDYIGWKDPYAQQRFTDRQRQYARLAGAGGIYTPQVVLAGADYRDWSGSRFARDVSAINGRTARADIELSAVSPSGNDTAFEFKAQARSAQSEPADLFVAVFDNRLTSKVTRGENAGSQLNHDYVVRAWLGPFALDGGKIALNDKVALPASQPSAERGVAAFVQARNGQVLQATACLLR